jgi:hypothetical protein
MGLCQEEPGVASSFAQTFCGGPRGDFFASMSAKSRWRIYPSVGGPHGQGWSAIDRDWLPRSAIDRQGRWRGCSMDYLKVGRFTCSTHDYLQTGRIANDLQRRNRVNSRKYETTRRSGRASGSFASRRSCHRLTTPAGRRRPYQGKWACREFQSDPLPTPSIVLIAAHGRKTR